MWTHIEDRTRTARKRYMCDFCGRPIPPGTPYLARVGVDDDEGWITSHIHHQCNRAASRMDGDRDWESGWDEGQFWAEDLTQEERDEIRQLTRGT